MAPIPPVGRARALAAVRAGDLPLWLGSPHPFVAIVEQDGVIRIRALVVDPAEAEAARTASLAAHGHWLPEQHYELGRPTGPIHLEAATRAELAAAIEAMPWPERW
ncbi:MAG: hypothetical protein IPL61_29315 [Myxococcales bacterium]|nr:hypothetical protein [Myxococcales bacterium]